MRPSAQQALVAALPRLTAAGIEGGARDARLLLAHAMEVAPDRLTLHLADPLEDAAAARFEAALQARVARRPVSQITGGRLFWGRRFRVTSDTLDPRPETEALVALALAERFGTVLDLGTGTGCILLTLLAERPEARGTGLDLSAAALAVARENAQRLDLADRADLHLSDWYAALPGAARYDLVVSNPPYIAADEIAALSPEVRGWEPMLALSPGGDGLDAYRRIAEGARAVLVPGGRILLEIGPTQGAAVTALLRQAGLERLAVHPDMDGRDRVVEGFAPAGGSRG